MKGIQHQHENHTSAYNAIIVGHVFIFSALQLQPGNYNPAVRHIWVQFKIKGIDIN